MALPRKNKKKKVVEPWSEGTTVQMKNGEFVKTGEIRDWGKKVLNWLMEKDPSITMSKLKRMSKKELGEYFATQLAYMPDTKKEK
jgi:hypothetical protein